MASSSKGNDKKEEDEHLEDAMDKIFHKKAFDYANLGGGPAGGTAAQVDSGARFYKPAKPSKDPGSIELDVKPVSSTQKEEKKKVKHAVPQIGALGAFTALSGGLIGGVSMSATQPAKKDVEKEEDEPTPASTEKGKLTSKPRRSGFRVGDDVSEDDIEPQVDVERRKFSTQFSITSADDEDFDAAATVDVRGHTSGANWESDEGQHHATAMYPHAHHVMPRIHKRKKKTSISSDDGNGSDHEADTHRKHSGHDKRRGSKKAEIDLLPTIEDESKVEFGIGATTTADDESEMETSTNRQTKQPILKQQRDEGVSESSMHSESETEDGHNNKFLKLNVDAGDVGKVSAAPKGRKGVKFSVGFGEDSEGDVKRRQEKVIGKEDTKDDETSNKKKRRTSHGHRSTKHELRIRRTIGSMKNVDEYGKMIADDDEVDVLENRDIDEMASHRMDRMGAVARHKISRELSKPDLVRVRRKKRQQELDTRDGGETTDAEHQFVSKMYGLDPSDVKQFDKTPHEIFVQLSELNDEHTRWVERSRWIKYEECKEEGAERWGRPHLSSLSFHSLINLRLCLEKAIIVLDYAEAKDFTNLVYKLVEECGNEGYITDDYVKAELLRLLLIRHKFVDATAGGMGAGNEGKLRGIKRSLSKASMANLMPSDSDKLAKSSSDVGMDNVKEGMKNGIGGQKDHLVIDMKDTSGGMPTAATFTNLYQAGQTVQRHGIMHRLKDGTEGTIVLVGTWEYINEPLCAFMRLAEGIVLPNTLEVPIPVRFVFLLLTPHNELSMSNIDPHEVGRSFSTMMSNPEFHDECYQISARKQLLTAINEFLDSSVVLPSGDWSSKNMISISEIQQLRKNKQAMKDQAKELKDPALQKETEGTTTDKPEEKEDKEKDEYDPMKRGPYLFYGVVHDIKNRFPHYLSDFKDALNGQCVAATIFIYFAALSGAVAFGGLTGDATKNQIGVPETMITSAVTGTVFALLGGQPLIITGLTGPILLYDESLFNFAEDMGVDFLQWRVWIGLWLLVIALLVTAFQGSVLVRYFSKFTKDIFASLVSLLFIVSALQKLAGVFDSHPLVSKKYYVSSVNCSATNVWIDNSTTEMLTSMTTEVGLPLEFASENNETALTVANMTDPNSDENDDYVYEEEPNTALLSFILMFGTFMIAYGLKLFRNGKYMGRTIRRALGDFGVPIAIVIMVAIDILAGDTYTKKLKVPFGLQTTIPTRGWIINPMVSNLTIELKNGTMLEGPRHIPIWLPFVSVVPAFLLFLLLFIETEICELIMLEKSKKKGGGLHWDIILLCLLNTGAAIFGGPWICAATVRGVAHVSALTVMSTTHAPGEAPHIVEVKDQRASALTINLVLGLSVLLAVVLEQIPFAVLYGVFLYMGISGINGIQLFDRLFLMLMPVKHHPRVGYVRRVKTLKMHLFTLIQFGGLAILWTVKSIPAIALAFPFFVVSMIGLRWSLKFVFTEKELDHLDGAGAGKAINDEDAEPDFYEEGIGG